MLCKGFICFAVLWGREGPNDNRAGYIHAAGMGKWMERNIARSSGIHIPQKKQEAGTLKEHLNKRSCNTGPQRTLVEGSRLGGISLRFTEGRRSRSPA